MGKASQQTHCQLSIVHFPVGTPLPIITAIDRIFRHGNRRVHRALEAMVVGKEDTVRTRNLVHLFGLFDSRGNRRVQVHHQGGDRHPSTDKADGNQEGFEGLKKRM